ncbi:hypothetical protein [Virgibacillus oceani]|uniref:Uncharacterized protein n=1 Tax=Virgibacillus oceani TaxID=1479511 RepID=A0A917HIE3_9BACI|nr:hypothetical protein [Virgibacillus oceani]GGG80037.1 hypothetical protein GCM10011398_26730 [Virgibacillus oceani]
MKPLIIQLLESKGMLIPESDYDELSELYESAKIQKQALDRSLLEDSDIAFKSVPGGDHVG